MRAYAEGLVLLALAVVALLGAWQVPAASPGDTWAGIVPFTAASALFILAALLVLGAVRSPANGSSDSTEPNDSSGNRAVLEVLGLFLVALVYQQSFRWFGYILPTAIVAPIVLYMFGVRNWIGLAVSVVVCPLVFHTIFFELLGVFPPYGEVFDLLETIRG